MLEEHAPGRVYHLDNTPLIQFIQFILIFTSFVVPRFGLGILIVDLVCWKGELPKIVASNKVAIPGRLVCGNF